MSLVLRLHSKCGSALTSMLPLGDSTISESGQQSFPQEKSAVGRMLSGSTEPSSSFLTVAPEGVKVNG